MVLRGVMSVMVFTLLSGCARIADFDVNPIFWKEKTAHVGIMVAKLPKARSFELGNQAGVDMQNDPLTTADLNANLSKMDFSDINKLADSFRDELQKQNFAVKRVAGYYDIKHLPLFTDKSSQSGSREFAEHDFRQFKSKWKLDKLLVISINMIGVAHDYHVTDPAGEHHGYAQITGEIINLSNNSLEWKRAITQLARTDVTNWESPSNFPILRRAVHTAFSHAQVNLFRTFVP